MNVIHYLKQCVAWFNKTPIAKFAYRLTAFCFGLLIYIVVISFSLILLLLLAVYTLSIGLISSQQKNDFDTMNPGSDNANNHFGEHKLPALPKW